MEQSFFFFCLKKTAVTDTAKAAKKLSENQARVEQLTMEWTEKWKEAQSIMQVGGVVIERKILGRVGRTILLKAVFHLR